MIAKNHQSKIFNHDLSCTLMHTMTKRRFKTSKQENSSVVRMVVRRKLTGKGIGSEKGS